MRDYNSSNAQLHLREYEQAPSAGSHDLVALQNRHD